MERFAAFLRGMNLGGRRLTNEELREHFAALGCGEPATFRASGNVVFSAGEPEEELAARLEAGLAERLGYEVPVFLRSAAEVVAVAAAEPFDPALVAKSKGKLQVAFPRAEPPARAGDAVAGLSTDEDRLALDGRELYWLPAGGISESGLDWRALEAAVGPTTVRTMGTVAAIAAKHLA